MRESELSGDSTPPSVSARPAATVILLRDGAAGLEVLLLKRAGNMAWGGQHVFPGGGVERGDREPRLYASCRDLDDAEASARLGLDNDGLSYWVAAIREVFEESGILLAHDGDHDRVPGMRASLDHYRRALLAREITLGAICEQEELRLSAGDIHYLSHWITPEYRPKRFATRFFVAAAPAGQVDRHDGAEIVNSVWVPVREATSKRGRCQYHLHPPQYYNLKHIEPYASLDELRGHMAGRPGAIEPVRPKIQNTRVGRRLTYPWEPGYSADEPR